MRRAARNTTNPFRDGIDAFNAHRGRHENPYQFGTPNYTQWREGWDAASRAAKANSRIGAVEKS